MVSSERPAVNSVPFPSGKLNPKRPATQWPAFHIFSIAELKTTLVTFSGENASLAMPVRLIVVTGVSPI